MLANFRPAPDNALAVARYRRLSREYDDSCRFIGGIRSAAVAALELNQGETVLDVACGTGATLRDLAERVGGGGRAVGIEQCPSMAAIARRRIAAVEMRDRITLIEASAEQAGIPWRADAVLFCYTHDVLQSPEALRNVFRQVKPGARVSVAGIRLQSWWWAAPINLWACLRSWPCFTTFHGLRCPWRQLQAYCPDLHVVRTFHAGMSYLAVGSVPREGGAK
ncbi:MAG: class I SAM-dependent methyltransferase [Burkholderiales bacterium]